MFISCQSRGGTGAFSLVISCKAPVGHTDEHRPQPMHRLSLWTRSSPCIISASIWHRSTQSPHVVHFSGSNSVMNPETAAEPCILHFFILLRIPQWHVQQLQTNWIYLVILLEQWTNPTFSAWRKIERASSLVTSRQIFYRPRIWHQGQSPYTPPLTLSTGPPAIRHNGGSNSSWLLYIWLCLYIRKPYHDQL